MPYIRGNKIAMAANIVVRQEGDLPELDNPAATGDILAGKEAIDENGEKMTGSLTICNNVSLDGFCSTDGTLFVYIKSEKDESVESLQLEDEWFNAENIKKDVDVFGLIGTLDYVAEKQAVPQTKDTDIIKVGNAYYLWEA